MLCTWFPQYNLSHFYQKSFFEGGLTFEQVIALFEHGTDIRYDDYKFNAAIHGIDLDVVGAKDKTKPKASTAEEFMFKDPREYEHLDAQAKKKITEDMKANHRQIFADLAKSRQEKAK